MYSWDTAICKLHGPLRGSRVPETPESLEEIMTHEWQLRARGSSTCRWGEHEGLVGKEDYILNPDTYWAIELTESVCIWSRGVATRGSQETPSPLALQSIFWSPKVACSILNRIVEFISKILNTHIKRHQLSAVWTYHRWITPLKFGFLFPPRTRTSPLFWYSSDLEKFVSLCKTSCQRNRCSAVSTRVQ